MTMNSDSTMNQFNALLQQSQAAMLCGPDCQKAKAGTTLEQNYLEAKTNVVTAPVKLDVAAKKYLTYTKGQAGYDDYITKELQTKADAIISELKKTFESNLKLARTMNDTYSTQLVNSQYATQVHDKYLEENTNLEHELKDNSYDIFTSDRKTYYEDQGLDSLKWWYALFFRLYFIIVIAYFIIFFISTSSYSILSRILIFLFLIIYPFVMPYVFNFIVRIFYRVGSVLPKNAYLHI